MQNETFKKIGKDLHGALSIPGNFLSKQAKKISLTGDKKRKNIAATASAAADGTGTQSLSKTCHSNAEIRIEKSLGLNAGSICDTVSKAAGLTAGSIGPSITPTAGVEGICSDNNNSGHSGQYLTATPNGLGSFTKSSHSSGSIRTYPKEEPPIIHCPPSIPSLDHFCTQRRAWIQNGSTSVTTAELKNVLKSGQVWDIMDNSRYGSQNLVKSGYYNLNEPLGILYVKVMQVTNKASSKLFDVEWSLKVGNTERTSYPSRSFKDNPGNTATMNEVFLFDVNGPFQLEMTVAGNPVPTKLGTMAGFSNNQTVTLGHLDLSFCLEPAEKSVHTYRLRKPTEELNKSGIKSDCEVVAMIGLHILEEPVEDRSWETEVLYQGFLTLMIRGGKMAVSFYH
ncbi:hypothetical protein BCR41DRAFT_133404 [Lobosporangium transversale]|uniref:Uncharacterized protein n=1 Tax=Lobosporangium transversale TaxID=64571 RepID=A0A1Y2GIJ7_9FUNG|nr:hypothetical protein BCR41DRAFT_133404 [Lobosporangium transversale]ORZ10063.1 hypothetical protein BCR41DRAFT_133404 [Lobosporangium transversale]|eukprot:XP_021879153.1 hypothetical protein BCR41DRAFT_133404 [Lobosporangium transversale]